MHRLIHAAAIDRLGSDSSALLLFFLNCPSLQVRKTPSKQISLCFISSFMVTKPNHHLHSTQLTIAAQEKQRIKTAESVYKSPNQPHERNKLSAAVCFSPPHLIIFFFPPS